MSRAAVLDALGDPTRRRILERLRPGPRPAGAIARGLPVSRPAVSQHLRVLERAGLVTVRKNGRQRIYRVDRSGLEQVRRWVDRFWEDALDAFEAEARRVAERSEESP